MPDVDRLRREIDAVDDELLKLINQRAKLASRIRTLDLLLTTPLRICGEVELRVQQNLLAKGELKDVRRVYSHAQSLGQCNAWLAQHLPNVERVAVASNAEAAQRAAGEAAAAAIAGEAEIGRAHV